MPSNKSKHVEIHIYLLKFTISNSSFLIAIPSIVLCLNFVVIKVSLAVYILPAAPPIVFTCNVM